MTAPRGVDLSPQSVTIRNTQGQGHIGGDYRAPAFFMQGSNNIPFHIFYRKPEYGVTFGRNRITLTLLLWLLSSTGMNTLEFTHQRFAKYQSLGKWLQQNKLSIRKLQKTITKDNCYDIWQNSRQMVILQFIRMLFEYLQYPFKWCHPIENHYKCASAKE